MQVEQLHVCVQGRPARVFSGGTGSALLLVHGGWAGAHFHWSRVWEQLARSHRVIAPDLPGLGEVEQPALESVRAYAEWLADLLTALGIEKAWVVGNSFGASVGWSFAARAPARCAGLVIVNGFAMPKTPRLLRIAGKTRAVHTLMEWLIGRFIYTSAAVSRAFVDPSLMPPEIERVMAEDWKLMIPRYVNVLIAGDGAPAPDLSIRLLWGMADRLPGTGPKSLARVQRSLRRSTVSAIEGAGHFPQNERPEAFVAALEDIVGSAQAGRREANPAARRA